MFTWPLGEHGGLGDVQAFDKRMKGSGMGKEWRRKKKSELELGCRTELVSWWSDGG